MRRKTILLAIFLLCIILAGIDIVIDGNKTDYRAVDLTEEIIIDEGYVNTWQKIQSLNLVDANDFTFALDQKVRLKGYDVLFVNIDDNSVDYKITGFTNSELRTKVENRLLESGINVISSEEWVKQRYPFLMPMLRIGYQIYVREDSPVIAFKYEIGSAKCGHALCQSFDGAFPVHHTGRFCTVWAPAPHLVNTDYSCG